MPASRQGTLALVALLGALCLAAPAQGASTLERTIAVQPGTGFRALVPARGERSLPRVAPGARAVARRALRRRSLFYFAQLSDLQLVDETSPSRKEYLTSMQDASYRAQEALTVQAGEALVRALNRHRRSPLRTGRGKRARLGATLLTGDQTDNAQLNEWRWVLGILDGGAVSPSAGALGACADAPGGAELYTGVQDWADFPGGVSQGRLADYWDPDRGQAEGPYGSLSYPGLMERAQRPFTAAGLAGRWYAVSGNHDALRGGLAPGAHPAFNDAVATGCSKAFPSDAFGPTQLGAATQAEALERLASPDVLEQLRRDSRPVPPDPARRMVGKRELRALHGTGDGDHGFGYTDRRELRASGGTAGYYAFSPRRGVRMVGLDTAAEGGRSYGNLDDPQYRWLARELDRSSSVSLDSRGRVLRDRDPNRLIVVYGHHPLTAMYNDWADERAPCTGGNVAGCDSDPRSSTPIHRGRRGPQQLTSLLERYPNVVAYVAGHSHRNRVTPHFREDRRGGFWEVVSASSIDFPGQARLLELMDNRDGTLSLFGTLIDHDAPIAPPPSGTPAASMSDTQLASLGRALAANNVVKQFGAAARGRRSDRNVELLLRDPRRLAQPRRPETGRPAVTVPRRRSGSRSLRRLVRSRSRSR